MHSSGSFATRPYRRSWWLPGAHAQTIGGWLFRSRADLPFHRQRIETPDGDFVDLDLSGPTESRPGDGGRGGPAPLVLILHGLEGGSRSLPARQAVREVTRLGMRAAVLNFRSCSGEPNRTARFYHAGETEDLRFVLGWLEARFPEAPVGVIGYSLGGNVLLKFLGEEGDAATSRIRSAVAVSVPFDLTAGATKLERGFGRVYAAHFLRTLLRKAREKEPLIGDRCDARRIRRSRTLREFDDAATAPLHGFRDVSHYYTSSSSIRFLHRIRVPTLLLHAVDDPFLPAESVPFRAARENPAITAAFTRHGGHMGFVSGVRPWAPEFWAEGEAARFLAHHLGTSARPHTGAPLP